MDLYLLMGNQFLNGESMPIPLGKNKTPIPTMIINVTDLVHRITQESQWNRRLYKRLK